MRRSLLIACLTACLGLSSVGRAQAAVDQLPTWTPFVPYENEFASAIVMTPKTHQVLYAFKSDLQHPAASLTKLVSGLAFLTRNISFNKTARLIAADEVGGGRLRVTSGASMTVGDMFYSSITASANNTAMALGRLSGLSHKAFLRLMQEEVKRAGAKQSVFFESAGMNPKNVTTAYDMALISDRAFANVSLRRAASTANYTFRVKEGKKTITKTIKNTNDLLTKDPDAWVIGGKTGYLEESKNNLAVRLRRLDERGNPVPGTDVIVIIFGAETKEQMFHSAKRLAEWTWNYHAFH